MKNNLTRSGHTDSDDTKSNKLKFQQIFRRKRPQRRPLLIRIHRDHPLRWHTSIDLYAIHCHGQTIKVKAKPKALLDRRQRNCHLLNCRHCQLPKSVCYFVPEHQRALCQCIHMTQAACMVKCTLISTQRTSKCCTE